MPAPTEDERVKMRGVKRKTSGARATERDERGRTLATRGRRVGRQRFGWVASGRQTERASPTRGGRRCTGRSRATRPGTAATVGPPAPGIERMGPDATPPKWNG
eukprot:scaffold7773_cov110-Isochrysis_galbana.AAC.2